MSRQGRYALRLVLLTIVGMLLAPMVFAESIPRISVDELNARLGEANLVILDARSPRDFDRATTKIAGSIRINPYDVSAWAKDLDKSATIVLYCA